MITKVYSLIVLFIFSTTTLNADGDDDPVKSPDKYFANQNYKAAIKGYQEELAKNPNDFNLNYQLGLCYLYSYIDKSKALFYLNKVKDTEDKPKEFDFYLAEAYRQNYKFDKAIELFKEFSQTSKDSTFVSDSKRKIIECNNAKYFLSSPKPVKIKNLGEIVNSDAPDYNVFCHENEEYIVFSSKRKKRNKAEKPSPDGWFTSDVFISYYENGTFTKPKVQSSVCTPASEEVIGLSSDGELMFLNILGRGATGEMVVSYKKGKSYKEPIKVEKSVNTSAIEVTASVSNDREKFYYASNRKGGKGGFDIYKSNRLPNLKWAEPQVIQNINSEFNEMFPQLSPDGKTLYFSSNGFNTMGGYDIFISKWDEKNKQWSKPENMGYPINTVFDDMHFSINKEGAIGYISSFRKNTLGDLDLYEVEFLEAERNQTVIRTKVYRSVKIDYSDYQVFNKYKHRNGKTVLTSENFLVVDSNLVFIEKEKIKQPEGKEFELEYVFNTKEGKKKILESQLPNWEVYSKYELVSTSKVERIKIKNEPEEKPETKDLQIKDITADVLDENGDILGQFKSNPKSGRLIMILPPGEYDLCVYSEDFSESFTKMKVLGKASFEKVIDKDIILPINPEEEPVNYKQIE